MTSCDIVPVELSDRTYDIVVADGLMSRLGELVVERLGRRRVVFLTDERVAAHWLSTARASLQAVGCRTTEIVVPEGEATKSFAQLERVIDHLLDAHVGRDWLMIALGGGTVFQLVVLSWSALASGLGPLLIVRVLGKAITTRVALLMMGAGIGMVLFWRYQLGLSGAIYDVLPGMAAGFAVYGLCFILGWVSESESESDRREAIDVSG